MAPSESHDVYENSPVGPHPSYIQIARPYIFQHSVQECLALARSNDTKDDSIRLQGVAWIDSVRKAMHLPVRTYNTAVVYYLKFRLIHPDNNGFIDAAAGALFAACKIEDTLKKSKEILCAAYNLKQSPAEQVTADDVLFENHSKTIIGLERLMLEASGFDFRNRYPQRLVLKLAKFYHVDKDTVGKTAYNMSLDLYRTFAPIKQTTSTLAIACVELSGRIFAQNIHELEVGKSYEQWRTTRPEVMETLLDLLDLYTHYKSSTIVGQSHVLEDFISVRIILNQEAAAKKYPRFTQNDIKKPLTNGIKSSNGISTTKEAKDSKSFTSPHDDYSKELRSPQSAISLNGQPGHGKPGLRDGTVRFMLDPQRAHDEKETVAEYFKVEEEEYVEVGRDRRRASPDGATAVLSSTAIATTATRPQQNTAPDRFSATARTKAGTVAESRLVRDGAQPRRPLGEQSTAFQSAKSGAARTGGRKSMLKRHKRRKKEREEAMGRAG